MRVEARAFHDPAHPVLQQPHGQRLAGVGNLFDALEQLRRHKGPLASPRFGAELFSGNAPVTELGIGGHGVVW